MASHAYRMTRFCQCGLSLERMFGRRYVFPSMKSAAIPNLALETKSQNQLDAFPSLWIIHG